METAAKVADTLNAPEKERDQAKHEVASATEAQAPDLPAIIHLGGGQSFEHPSCSQLRNEAFISFEERERRYHEFISDPLTSLYNCPVVPPPSGALAAFNSIFGDLGNDVKLLLHPLYKRWCVFARGRTKDGAVGWYPALVICHTPQYGILPQDLAESLPRELQGMFTGRMGEYKEPTALDLLHLRDFADRYRWKKRSSKEQAAKLEAQQKAEYAARHKARWEETRDFVEYNKGFFERDMNRKYGAMQGFNTVPQTSLEQFDKEHPRWIDIPVTSAETGEVLYYSRFVFKNIARMKEEAIEEAARFKKELDEAGLDKRKVAEVKAKYLDPEILAKYERGAEVAKALRATDLTSALTPSPASDSDLAKARAPALVNSGG